MAVEATNETAGEFPLVIEQGIDLGGDGLKTYWKDSTGTLIAGLENWTGRMQIRSTINSDEVLLDLTTENSGLVLGGTVGEVKIVITSAQSNAFDWSSGVYDLELINTSNIVTRYLRGTVKVIRGVTR